MNELFTLCWGLNDDPETRKLVFSEREIRVAPELPVLDAIKGPTEGTADLPPSATWETITLKFLDLTQHPFYTASCLNTRVSILPGGIDQLLILPAYENILQRAEELNHRYRTSESDVAPVRNMILSGVPGMGIGSNIVTRGYAVNMILGKSCCQDFRLVTRLAAKMKTVIQPYWLKGHGT